MNMKKKFYLLLLAIQLLTAFGYAAQADDVVRRIRLHKNTIHTRSLTDAPEASIQRDILTVSFDGSGMYSLYINVDATLYERIIQANITAAGGGPDTGKDDDPTIRYNNARNQYCREPEGKMGCVRAIGKECTLGVYCILPKDNL